MQCNVCNKEFSTKGSLYTHQKTAKYCLEKQGKNNEEFNCIFCQKKFTLRHVLHDHLQICKEKSIKEMSKDYETEIKSLKKIIEDKDRYYTDQIDTLKEIITKLEAMLEKFENAVIANTRNPITTTNNTIVLNNTLNLNDTEKFKSIIGEGLNKNVVCNGQKGLAKFVFDNILKGPDGKLMYKCVDPSRQNFEFTNSDGIVEKDVKAIKLKRALIEGDVIVKAQKSGEELWTKEDGSMDTDRYAASSGKVMEIMTVDRDDTKFRSELSALTS